MITEQVKRDSSMDIHVVFGEQDTIMSVEWKIPHMLFMYECTCGDTVGGKYTFWNYKVFVISMKLMKICGKCGSGPPVPPRVTPHTQLYWFFYFILLTLFTTHED